MDKFGAPGVEDGLKNRKNPVKFDFLDLFWFLQRLLCNCASTRPPVVQTDGLVVTGGEGTAASRFSLLSFSVSFHTLGGAGTDLEPVPPAYVSISFQCLISPSIICEDRLC